MVTNDNPTARSVCLVPGCGQPRKSYPSGRIAPRCAEHESARVLGVMSRPTVDPETGETVKTYTLQRRLRAQVKP